jgi:hypothetical protein
LIAAHKGHRQPASLRTTFTTDQSTLKESVTLLG